MDRLHSAWRWFSSRRNSPRDLVGSVFVGFWLGIAVYALAGPNRAEVPEAVQVVLVAVIGASVGIVGAITAASISGEAAVEAANVQTSATHALRFADRKLHLAAKMLDELFLLLDHYRIAEGELRGGRPAPSMPASEFYRSARELRLIVELEATYKRVEDLLDAMVAMRSVLEATPFVAVDTAPLVRAVRDAHIAFERQIRRDLDVAELEIDTR